MTAKVQAGRDPDEGEGRQGHQEGPLADRPTRPGHCYQARAGDGGEQPRLPDGAGTVSGEVLQAGAERACR